VGWHDFRVVTDGGYAANAKGTIAFLSLVETLIVILLLIFNFVILKQNRNLPLLCYGMLMMSNMM
jgi:hypothetical protein